MRPLLLPALLTLVFIFPASASDRKLPQWPNSFGMTFNRIQREKLCWAGVSPKRTVTIRREFSMGMPETIPQCGISYEEAQQPLRFSETENGSLQLMPF